MCTLMAWDLTFEFWYEKVESRQGNITAYTKWTHQVHIFLGKLLQWGKMSLMQRHFLKRGIQMIWSLMMPVHTSILTLKEGFEGQISGKNIEIGIIGIDKKFRVLTPAEIDDYLAEVE
uniref:Uncharacterized protein n=1 Tax=Quercus lobata TaxID=97700 RepID=A0A7N2R3R6_QUELO